MRLARHSRGGALAVLVACVSTLTLSAVASPAAAAPAIRNANQPTSVPDSYLVVFKDETLSPRSVNDKINALLPRYGGQARHQLTATLRGFTGTMDEAAARRWAADPAVAYVEQDAVIARIQGTQPNPTWGLDRIDQRALPVDNSYTYNNDGSGATSYVVDTGVDMSHTDFEGRATSGYDFIDNDANAADCNGHGTHVAGTVGSKTWGVAKKAKLVAVRVLDCAGNGSLAAIVNGTDWVVKNAAKPAVMNMSLSFNGINDSADTAVKKAIDAGVTTVLAAGNANQDACGASPGRLPSAITVAASDSADKRSIWTGGQASNFGSCVDLFAPGSTISSTLNGGGSGQKGGTSMAAPHVAGAAALYLTWKPASTPAEVAAALVGNATPDKITDIKGSPNKLLYTGFIGSGGGGDCAAVSNGDDVAIADQATVSSPVTVANCTGNGTAATQVKVDINHTYTGDLAVDLVAPDGTAYSLKQAGGDGSSAGIHQTYSVDTTAEAKNGGWKLQVRDIYRYDVGVIDAWTLTF